ncbi:PREDICTED: F-box/LRR-repeat protein 13-like isoform X2 [Fragaria vesca subsp. vesca]|uniref:F-box/LRR-repeat protein 13-like isoform X2 n=1 Tax=Fragaria vesca subsp. vesca TaxID=101020 RepID=UPI0002C33031|nr:PREDICTED: F-box/LRR-repeat protein 13-like isoform X2 [Fragaria vesca subsp. vesca]
MEHKNKSLATATSEAQGACAVSMVDRLSSVPCKVAHRILSLVSFKDLTCVGSLSKRCREYYLSNPSLKLSSLFGNRQRQLNFLNCCDRYMICRRGDKIKSFSIQWDFSAGTSEESFRMMTWILIAVRCNVEVLDLQLRLNRKDGATLQLPSCIYCCESLRSLLINTETIIKAPSFACPNNLQYLKLTTVTMDDGFGKWISCSCKCIKELLLKDVHVGSFTIESSSLESFTLSYTYNCEPCYFSISGEKLAEVNIKWETEANSSITRSLNVYAPNLKYLKWIGDLLDYQNLGKFMCLEKAQIFLKCQRSDYDFDNAIEVLCSFYKAKSLVLSGETIKVLLREGSLHAPLDGTTYLGMHVKSLSDDLVPAMVSLLRGMPNLKTLYINSYPSLNVAKPKACGFKKKYWKSQNLDCIHQLEEVSISLSTGYPTNALELAIYILEHAPKLKKMVIYYLRRRQLYIIEKVNKSKKVSSATVIFKEREVDDDEAMGDMYYRQLYRWYW